MNVDQTTTHINNRLNISAGKLPINRFETSSDGSYLSNSLFAAWLALFLVSAFVAASLFRNPAEPALTPIAGEIREVLDVFESVAGLVCGMAIACKPAAKERIVRIVVGFILEKFWQLTSVKKWYC